MVFAMETNSLYELLLMMEPTESQLKEFFIYHCASIKDTMIAGVEYGLQLAGKDMESTEGKEFMAEITKHYEDKFPRFVQDSIDTYLKYLLYFGNKAEDDESVEKTEADGHEELKEDEANDDEPIEKEEVDA